MGQWQLTHTMSLVGSLGQSSFDTEEPSAGLADREEHTASVQENGSGKLFELNILLVVNCICLHNTQHTCNDKYLFTAL